MGPLYEEHMEWVQKLKDRGETALQPEYGEPIGSIRGYIKTQKPHKEVGAIFQDSDKTFGLFVDRGALLLRGISWDNLGLCDARCGYEWMDPDTYQPEKEGAITKTIIDMNQIHKSLQLSEEIYKKGRELEDLHNKYLAALRARTAYLEDDVVAGLHNEGLEPGNWELFVNRVLREALQALAGKQER